jgi:hypothetical protein
MIKWSIVQITEYTLNFLYLISAFMNRAPTAEDVTGYLYKKYVLWVFPQMMDNFKPAYIQYESKRDLYTFAHIFGKYRPIFKILSQSQ